MKKKILIKVQKSAIKTSKMRFSTNLSGLEEVGKRSSEAEWNSLEDVEEDEEADFGGGCDKDIKGL